MKLSDENLSDEDLMLFADGALSAEDSATVQERITNSSDAQKRLKLARLSAEALADSTSHDMDRDAVVMHAEFIRTFGLERTEPRQSGRLTGKADVASVRWWQIAAAAILFAGGVGVGIAVDRWQTASAPQLASTETESGSGMTSAAGGKSGMAKSAPGTGMASDKPGSGMDANMDANMGGWVASVVEYQNLYTRATVEPTPKPDAHGVDMLQERLGTALGAKLVVPDLDTVGLEFRRGQILQFDKRPLVQLAYLPDGKGRPVALCIISMDGDKRAPTYSKRLDMGVVRWSDGKLDYVLVGWQSEGQLLKAADLAIARFNRT